MFGAWSLQQVNDWFCAWSRAISTGPIAGDQAQNRSLTCDKDRVTNFYSLNNKHNKYLAFYTLQELF